jgi:putative FmdB family regulatory protein
MPIYEYKCKKCGNDFEWFCFRSTDEAELACPSCGGKKADKMMSSFACTPSDAGDAGNAMSAPSSCTPRGGFS